MKKFLFAMFGAVLVLGACGDNGGNDEDQPVNDGNNAETTDNAADEGTYDLANGEELYAQNCASCHGGDLEGASGPNLQGSSQDEVRSAIEAGPGTMPADLVTGDDADDVAAWVADQ
ncbi:c-type cytochrome [Salipaludibacillus aurantiacus]|uniref:Cytochrome c551 n=1 Tax=Salipaludibacillus aurantiacus TaxID=1601833 RepID=A0A1H9WXN4_9BACI|nr:cytochrome c [Salipaludibacillus aurantiacus]SES38615.1 cytochrome c551 [Salipaludibacillus aurantiacus]